MNKRHLYNNIIERKLEQLPAADASLLWNDMHLILDKKMPQKKERRRFIGWWLLTGKGLVLLMFVFLMITGSSLIFLSSEKNATVSINKLSGSQQADKFIANGEANVSEERKENTITASGSNQRNRDNISATASATRVVDHLIYDRLINEQAIKESKKYTPKGKFNDPKPGNVETPENFVLAPVNLESIHQGLLITPNHHREKKSLSPQPEPMSNKLITRNPVNNNESGFYAGIVSGVDLSSIHFKSLRTGSTKGFIIGYAFNKKWSIESGLLWDTKRVYDNGSYFKPQGYTPTNGITITAVNGKSRLYELPVNIKYTILSGKHSLFATTGLSSYIMRSENYDYEYEQNNQPGGHNYLTYKNETKDWFSVANISVGYTRKLGAMGSLRVEPYLKLPLKNLGVGNMPIMSTGLNVGYIKKLRR